MTYTPTNWVDGATPLNRANMMRIENELALLDPSTAIVSATPPASPTTGQLWWDATHNWMFRYDSAISGSSKWVYIGGSPVYNSNLGSGAMVGAWTAYLPTITAPFAGVYRVAASATITMGGTGSILGLSYSLNGGFGFNTNQGTGFCTASNSMSLAINPTPITVAAGDIIGVSAYTGFAANILLAWLSIEPQRVG